MKANGEIKFKNEESIFKVRILIDTGASHCFINPKLFNESIRTKINNFKFNNIENNLELKLLNGSIQTVNANNKSVCVFVDLMLNIGNWHGIQEFIISDEIENENCILGRNFLKKYNVKIDYGNNKLTIKSALHRTVRRVYANAIDFSDSKFIQRF